MAVVTGAIDEAVRLLTVAGIETAREDAEELAAYASHAAGEPATQLFGDLVRRRAERIPLGHLVGRAVLGGIEVEVGPGVFVPRVHSERVLAAGLRLIEAVRRPVVADLCTGSGALALAIAHARPDATVHAVEMDDLALEFAARNRDRRAAAGDTPIVLHRADVAAPGLLSGLLGAVDLLLINPPFVPEGVQLLPEYGVHHPAAAIFSGPDGLGVIRPVAEAATALLRPGGGFVVEHGPYHEAAVPSMLRADPRWTEVGSGADHRGLPLLTTARRADRTDEGVTR
uniref:N5-glutamine methyltransferase family protein n=1 Tax=Paractinoplanes polyasparticus TaxID=2856853 RepID=UPI001C84EB36|nr:HemK/PrmC family methyltransferase [Actinoplanes polyasparticus]